tara:strand:- start:21 stop:185 length:165 start_codon:yes stop_codon:yes gene_type:complete
VNVSIYIRGNNSKKKYWDKASASPKEEIVLQLLIIEGGEIKITLVQLFIIRVII